jgi:prephenate dehydrogenase
MDEPGFRRLAGARVAIVGLGLMGGSLALALRGHCRELWGADADPRVAARAADQGVIDQDIHFEEAFSADVLVLAAPVRAILDQLAELAGGPPPPQPVVVLDLGSTKAAIASAMADLPDGFDPVGGHPMCGKEVSGLDHAEADLFSGKVFVLTPLARTSPIALHVAEAVVAAVGARPLRLSPEQHDRLAAHASHLPYAAAVLLVRAASALDDPGVWQVAASGFRDTSRLALSDVTMMLDILLTNRDEVLAALAGFRAELDALRGLLEAPASELALRAFVEAARARRDTLFQ